MADENAIREAAARLWQAWETGETCAPVRELIGETDIEAAYAVQEINTQKYLEGGARLVGRKIGLTAHAVQVQLGVDQPDYGMLFADMDVPDGEEIPWRRLHQPKVEAEVAFVMGDDLDFDQITTVDVMAAVEFALPAIEVVGSRIANWDIRITDTVADNGSAAMFVLGQEPTLLGDFDLRLCGMTLSDGIEPRSSGVGAACLGSPLNSLRWLARTMQQAGRPLQAGDVVLSGALGPMVAANPGDVFEARIDGLGSVRVAFGKEEQ